MLFTTLKTEECVQVLSHNWAHILALIVCLHMIQIAGQSSTKWKTKVPSDKCLKSSRVTTSDSSHHRTCLNCRGVINSDSSSPRHIKSSLQKSPYFFLRILDYPVPQHFLPMLVSQQNVQKPDCISVTQQKCESTEGNYIHLVYILVCLQCFDAAGWAAGRASGP